MSEYAKAILPLAVGLIVGVVLLAFHETETGIAVLLAAAGASGLSFAVPNRPAIRPVRDLHDERGYGLVELLVVAILLLVFVALAFSFID